MGFRKPRLGVVLPFLLVTQLSSQVVREVRVPLVEGKVSVLELSRALLDEYGFAGEHVSFPDVRVDVSGAKGFLILSGISKALRGTTRLRRVDGGETLLLRIDRAKVREVRQSLKRDLLVSLGVLTGTDLLERTYELDLPASLGEDEPLVLCVHGVDSGPQTFADLRGYLSAQGVVSGTFGYANDEAIDRIAEELSARLKAHKGDHPDRRVVIVAHSMGGLVARSMLETPRLDPQNVSTLIMLGTPNQGSHLARFRNSLDLLELLEDPGDRPRVLAPFLDGVGEASLDLRPGSPFLVRLNSRPRNPAVSYHLILGNRGLISADDLAEARGRIEDRVSRIENNEIFAGKVSAFLRDLPELVQGEGDGAVALSRGRLEGVEEVVVPLDHLALLRRLPDGEQPVFPQVLAWIRAARDE